MEWLSAHCGLFANKYHCFTLCRSLKRITGKMDQFGNSVYMLNRCLDDIEWFWQQFKRAYAAKTNAEKETRSEFNCVSLREQSLSWGHNFVLSATSYPDLYIDEKKCWRSISAYWLLINVFAIVRAQCVLNLHEEIPPPMLYHQTARIE